jgi:hypothetical protein
VCTKGETSHIDAILKFLSHTRQHGCIGILIHTHASPSGRNVNYDEKQLSVKIRIVLVNMPNYAYPRI